MSKILDGSALAKKIRSNLKLQTEEYIKKYNIVPHLAVILVGADPASETYVRFKEKACNQVGIKSTIINLPETILEEDLIKETNSGIVAKDSVHLKEILRQLYSEFEQKKFIESQIKIHHL